MTRSVPLQAVLLTTVGLGALCASCGIANATEYIQTDLVSDIPGLADITDPNLKNTWGVANLPGSPFWISNNVTSRSSLYTVTGSTGVKAANLFPQNFVDIPTTAVGPQGPTGIVANSGTSFGIVGGPAFFIFANLNGTISAWNLSNVNHTTNAATIEHTTPGALYTGLAINSTGTMLYAANGATGKIDVFNGSFAPTTVPGGFVDPSLPAGLVPFNVEDVGTKVYVTYAPAGHTAQADAKAGDGVVDIFNEDGVLQQRLVTGGALASPWGMAIAPSNFGQFSGDLLVGNFAYGDSEINAFNAMGVFEGTIHINPGVGNMMAGGLWDLTFGSGGSGSSTTLYFTDGLNGETDGLFGAIESVPEPSTWAMMLLGFGGLALLAARRRAGLAIS